MNMSMLCLICMCKILCKRNIFKRTRWINDGIYCECISDRFNFVLVVAVLLLLLLFSFFIFSLVRSFFAFYYVFHRMTDTIDDTFTT